MSRIATLRDRNAEFVAARFAGELPPIPSMKTVVITCADPRVDPAYVLGLELGEAAVVRNAGGRITPATLQAVAMMATVVAEEGASGGFELILVHHTDCGVARLAPHEGMIAAYFGIPVEQLAEKHVTDPYRAVAADIEALRSNPLLPDDLIVGGLVYEVESGEAVVAVPPGPLRPPAEARSDRRA
jgi:carbonic anhydrase